MYKLIIADDEKRILTLLSQVIKWEELGFEVVGLFSDGSEVLSYIENNHVDCILCDICMNHVSGIDIAEFVFNNMPNIKVFFISGHQDFHYAVNALRYNVDNYFLKPVKVEEIKTAFKKLKNTLDELQSNSKIISLYKRDILKNLVSGVYTDLVSINNALKQVHPEITYKNTCALLKIEFEQPIDKDSIELMNLFSNIPQFNKTPIYVYYLNNNNNIVEYILFSKTLNASRNLFSDISEAMSKNICENLGSNTKVFNFLYFDSALELHQRLDAMKNNVTTRIKEFEQPLISAINSGNVSEIELIITSISTLLNPIDINTAKECFNILFNGINPSLLITIVADDITTDKDMLKSINSIVENSVSHNELYRGITTFFSNIALTIKNTDIQKRNILRIRNYISAHYSEDLSLDSIASIACLSPSYLSTIFKNIVGQTYIDFLASCRINKAKDMLINSNMKIHEISEAVGYRNIRSFTKFFRSHSGMTPSEYRNKFSGGNSNV